MQLYTIQITISSADISASDIRPAVGKPSPGLYCVACIDNKPIKITEAVVLEQAEWNETFDIRVNLHSPLESHLLVEVGQAH